MGLRLNHPEADAVLTDHLLEGARDGRTVADALGTMLEPANGGCLATWQGDRLG